MALEQIQAALARLYTDEEFRRGFASAPESAGSQFGLTLDEIDQLRVLADRDDGIGHFARSLIRKRCNEAAKILTMTRRLLGSEFARYFFEYANSHKFDQNGRHNADAIVFGKWCLDNVKSVPESVREEIRYETDCLEMELSRRRMLCRIYRCGLSANTSEKPRSTENMRTLVIWMARGFGDGRVIKLVFRFPILQSTRHFNRAKSSG